MTRNRTSTTTTTSRTRSIFEPLESRQMMSAGDLDPTFGAGGRMISQAVGFAVADVAVQRDGKIIAVGSLNKDFAVARVNLNGSLDKAFGGNNTGIARADFGGDRGDFAKAVAIQRDGKIVVGGHMDDTSFTTLADVSGFVIARFNTDGTLDKSFDGDGKAVVDSPGADRSFVSALAIQPDGKIVAAGTAGTRGRFAPPGDSDDFVVARLNTNGSLDRTFGSRLPFNNLRSGQMAIGLGSDHDSATAIALAPDGKILIGGTTTRTSRDIAHVGIARLTASGDQDKSFGDGGEAIQSVRGINVLTDIALAPDGKVIAVASGDEGNFAMVRFTSAGKTDTTLNGNGIVITDLGGNDRANSVRINSDGILVAGTSNGQFALARYRPSGALDQTFGKGGKATTAFGGNSTILATSFTADGKILAFGRRSDGAILSARYVAVLPKVNVFSLDPSGSESGGNNASLIFTRDVRATFTTRVFFDLGGTATLGADYTGPATTRLVNTGKVTPGGLAPVTLEQAGFVDILPGETFAIVPITVIDDQLVESTETVNVSLRTSSAYAVGDRTTQAVSIANNDVPSLIRVNFQSAAAARPRGFDADTGLTFGERGPGLTYGWDADNTANARLRNNRESPDLRYDTLNHMQKSGADRKWEIALPNGTYMVRLVAGDPSNTDSVYKMNLENQLALAGTPSGDRRFFRRTTVLQVTDGRLTLTNATGAVNNRVNFLEIKSVAPRTKLGTVAAVTARLKNAATVNIWKPQTSGLFSDNQIDEPLFAS